MNPTKIKDGIDGVDGLNGAVSVTVSPDGRHAYAAGRDDDAVAVFSRNAATGELTFQQTAKHAQPPLPITKQDDGACATRDIDGTSFQGHR